MTNTSTPLPEETTLFRLHEDFLLGILDTNEFIDIGAESEAVEDAVREFAKNVIFKKSLPGKNRSSKNLKSNDRRGTFERAEVWHYHCGPNFNPTGTKSTTWKLEENMNGGVSGELIHYSKFKLEKTSKSPTLTIIGYSPTHTSFPHDGQAGNPLVGRAKNLEKSTDYSIE